MDINVALESIQNTVESACDSAYDSGFEDGEVSGRHLERVDMQEEVEQQIPDAQKQAYIDGYTACMQQVHDRAEFLCDVDMRDFVRVLEDHLLKLQMWKIGTADYPPALVARASGS